MMILNLYGVPFHAAIVIALKIALFIQIYSNTQSPYPSVLQV